jgi:hypothetical protein
VRVLGERVDRTPARGVGWDHWVAPSISEQAP